MSLESLPALDLLFETKISLFHVSRSLVLKRFLVNITSAYAIKIKCKNSHEVIT